MKNKEKLQTEIEAIEDEIDDLKNLLKSLPEVRESAKSNRDFNLLQQLESQSEEISFNLRTKEIQAAKVILELRELEEALLYQELNPVKSRREKIAQEIKVLEKEDYELQDQEFPLRRGLTGTTQRIYQAKQRLEQLQK